MRGVADEQQPALPHPRRLKALHPEGAEHPAFGGRNRQAGALADDAGEVFRHRVSPGLTEMHHPAPQAARQWKTFHHAARLDEHHGVVAERCGVGEIAHQVGVGVGAAVKPDSRRRPHRRAPAVRRHDEAGTQALLASVLGDRDLAVASQVTHLAHLAAAPQGVRGEVVQALPEPPLGFHLRQRQDERVIPPRPGHRQFAEHACLPDDQPAPDFDGGLHDGRGQADGLERPQSRWVNPDGAGMFPGCRAPLADLHAQAAFCQQRSQKRPHRPAAHHQHVKHARPHVSAAAGTERAA